MTPKKTMSDKNDDRDDMSSAYNDKSIQMSARSLSMHTKRDSESKSKLISTGLFSNNMVSSSIGSIQYVRELTNDMELLHNLLDIIIAKAKIPLK